MINWEGGVTAHDGRRHGVLDTDPARVAAASRVVPACRTRPAVSMAAADREQAGQTIELIGAFTVTRESKPSRSAGDTPFATAAHDEFARAVESNFQNALRGVLGKERLMPAGERLLMINGTASCVAVHGRVDDPAVLLVGSSMLSWPDELCERLVAGGRRVIRYDVRDSGRSESYPPGEPGYSLADLVDDAVGVLDATATDRAHLAGMSTGGWIAQLLALSHPERVATLTLIASRPNPPGPVDDDLPGHHDEVMKAIRNTPAPDWSDDQAVVDYLVRRARTLAGAGAFDESAARAHAEAEVARTTNIQCALTNIAYADHGPRLRERLGEITARTLVLHGEDDPFFPKGNGAALATEIPHARLVRLARAGHQLPAHAIPIVAEELLAHTAD
ncbi:MAG: Pimeloyl-ACP methyl ester carboxylesterase [Pseudonocardiales bacterium]|nr:Pimeloyl-ACP methyl ester carboxylesterase [Pseudonocardiales bacterium]